MERRDPRLFRTHMALQKFCFFTKEKVRPGKGRYALTYSFLFISKEKMKLGRCHVNCEQVPTSPYMDGVGLGSIFVQGNQEIKRIFGR
jgi:hypothetical protein